MTKQSIKAPGPLVCILGSLVAGISQIVDFTYSSGSYTLSERFPLTLAVPQGLRVKGEGIHTHGEAAWVTLPGQHTLKAYEKVQFQLAVMPGLPEGERKEDTVEKNVGHQTVMVMYSQ